MGDVPRDGAQRGKACFKSLFVMICDFNSNSDGGARSMGDVC